MKRTYKLTASRGDVIVFDKCIQADTPRNARRERGAPDPIRDKRERNVDHVPDGHEQRDRGLRSRPGEKSERE